MTTTGQPIDIAPAYLAIVRDILDEHVPDCEVRAFGSRATWIAKDYSDLDLAIVSDQPIKWRVLSELKDAFEESYLPFRVDVLDWHDISDNFREIIRGDCTVIKTGNQLSEPTLNKWPTKHLDDCATLIRESISPSSIGDIPYIGLEHIGEGTLSLLDHGIASDVTSTKSSFKKGDILFGKLRPYFRKIIRAPFDGICSTDIWVVRAKDGVDQGYLYYCMASQHFVDFASAGSIGTRMPRAKWDYVSQYRLPVPTLSEQRKRAQILETLDNKIELNRRMNKTLEATVRAMFRSWFVDFDPVRAKIEGRWLPGESLPSLPAHLYDLFPDRLVPSKLGEIPEGWEITTIDKKVTVVGGSTPSTKEPSYWDGSINWVTPKDLSNLNSPVLLETDKKITDMGLKKISSGLLPSGTVLLSSRAPIGYTAITEIPVAINQGFIAMKCEHLASLYVWLWTVTNHESILTMANGSTFQEVNKRSFRTLPLCIPPTPVRKNFQYVAEDLYKLIVKNEQGIRILKGLHRSLLPTVVSN